MSEQQPDITLVERTQQGDQAAFGLLVEKYQHRLAKLVARYVKDSGEIEDVCQEAFIKAYRAIGNFRGDSAFYTWLYRIAVNTAKNYLISQGRRPPKTDLDAEEVVNSPAGAAMQETGTPEANVLTKEMADAVSRAVEQLPEDLRMAITLREIEGLSYDEIAEVMNCPIGTVRSRIFRARDAIDRELKPLLE
jgi:RNA polymerase sigma-70 factor (ECF subfamily)